MFLMVIEVNNNEEPVAGKPHGGFCEGHCSFYDFNFKFKEKNAMSTRHKYKDKSIQVKGEIVMSEFE